MRQVLVSLVVMFSAVFAYSAPKFSAFTADGVLHVTVLGDDCNRYFGGLEVPAICDKDRLTKNLCRYADVQLRIGSTRMGCAKDGVPRVVSIELDKTQLASEADILNLMYNGETIEIGVNR